VKPINQSVSAVSVVLVLLLSLSANTGYSPPLLPIAEGQPENHLPVLLIHGYRSPHDVWNDWVNQLESVGIEAEAVSFNDDPATALNEYECGSAEDHAAQLSQLVTQFKEETGSDKINIVTHSKGGLDARLYLADNPSSEDVANLIMIGTPNEGSPLADLYYESDDCKPAVFDLITTSPVLGVERNEHTKYYTIASDGVSVYYWPFLWLFEDINCPYPSNWFNLEGWNFLAFQYNGRNEIIGPDDGIVPVESVEEEGQYQSLGRTDDCHTNMFTNEEFEKVIGVLLN
jgi:pimeloyl-ACP methyl ester carboxylesterase